MSDMSRAQQIQDRVEPTRMQRFAAEIRAMSKLMVHAGDVDQATVALVEQWADEADAISASQEAEIAQLKKAVVEAKGDAIYHADCRPNRRQAEAWRDDAKAMNDRWADERKRVGELEAELSAVRQALKSYEEKELTRDPVLAFERLLLQLVMAAADASGRLSHYNAVSAQRLNDIAKKVAVFVADGQLRRLVAAPVATPATQLGDDEIRLLAWAVSNCHTLARRRIYALDKLSGLTRDRVDGPVLVTQEWEFWRHVQRICEKAGARSAGVLRASLPTEITDGAAPVVTEAPQSAEDYEAAKANGAPKGQNYSDASRERENHPRPNQTIGTTHDEGPYDHLSVATEAPQRQETKDEEDPRV